MDFSQVISFVSAAKEANTSVYGHTLVWHAQQNNKYLNSLLADKEIEIDPNATVEVVDGMKDYSKEPFTGLGWRTCTTCCSEWSFSCRKSSSTTKLLRCTIPCC